MRRGLGKRSNVRQFSAAEDFYQRCWITRRAKRVLALLPGLRVAFQGWRSLRELRPWLPAVIPSGDRGNETRCFMRRGGRLRSAAQGIAFGALREVRTTLLAHARCPGCLSHGPSGQGTRLQLRRNWATLLGSVNANG